MLEKKEIYIADFYFKTKDYFAAKARYEDILVTLKDEQERPRIMARIVESEEKLNQKTN
jgi:outer membrane protein assembly factor BamD